MNLHPTSQLVERSLGALAGPRLLVIGCPADGIGPILRQGLPSVQITELHLDYSAYQRQIALLTAAGCETASCVFGAWHPPVDEPFDTALIFLPRSNDLTEMMLANVAGLLRMGGRVVLVGENKAGIRSQRETLRQFVGSVDLSKAARHCVAYRAILEAQPAQPTFLDDWATEYEVEVKSVSLRLFSFPGMFSKGRLDAGTRFLLENLTIPDSSRVLDLGCGSGAVGTWIAKRWPASRVDMVDPSALAIEAAKRTVKANDLSNCCIRASDVCSEIDSNYACIVTYPPFHTEASRDYGLWRRFIEDAAQHLGEGGRLVLCAPSHLPCRRTIG